MSTQTAAATIVRRKVRLLTRLLARPSVLAMAAVVSSLGWTQTITGTMETTLKPSGRSAQEEYELRVSEFRRGGMTDQQIAASEAMIRESAARLAQGPRSTSSFEYVRSGESTWVSYPVNSSALGREFSQHIESFDGENTVRVEPSGIVIEPGDKRTFTGNALWQVALCGTVQGWLQEVSATAGANGETVVYEGVKDDVINRLVVTYADSARSKVVHVDQGYVTPPASVKPGIDPYVRAATATMGENSDRIEFDFFAGGKPIQHVTLTIEGREPEGKVELLRGAKLGDKVVDLRLGAKAPVNYAFDGTLPDLAAISSKPEPKGALPISASVAGLLGIVSAVWIWKRK